MKFLILFSFLALIVGFFATSVVYSQGLVTTPDRCLITRDYVIDGVPFFKGEVMVDSCKYFGPICFINKVYVASDWIFWLVLASSMIFIGSAAYYTFTGGGDPSRTMRSTKILGGVVIGIVLIFASKAVPAIISGAMDVTSDISGASTVVGRDEKRLKDVKKIKAALQDFFDYYGNYPSHITDPGEALGACLDSGWDDSDCREFIPGLTGSNVRGDNPDNKIFLQGVLGDPLGPDGSDDVCSQSYEYQVSGGSYELIIKPEQNPFKGIPDAGFCPGYDIVFVP